MIFKNLNLNSIFKINLAAVITLSEREYNTEEPSSSDTTIIKPVTVSRSGDLSRTTIVRISTADNTAIAGVDYKPKTETLTFLPGVSAVDFDVEIFHDSEREVTESFYINLGPQDPISGVFGEITKAEILIHDTNDLNGIKSNKNSIEPFVSSLYEFLNDGANKNDGIYAPSDESLICFHVSFFIYNF